MKGKTHSTEEIIRILRQADACPRSFHLFKPVDDHFLRPKQKALGNKPSILS
jgi:hypothetical protein